MTKLNFTTCIYGTFVLMLGHNICLWQYTNLTNYSVLSSKVNLAPNIWILTSAKYLSVSLYWFSAGWPNFSLWRYIFFCIYKGQVQHEWLSCHVRLHWMILVRERWIPLNERFQSWTWPGFFRTAFTTWLKLSLCSAEFATMLTMIMMISSRASFQLPWL